MRPERRRRLAVAALAAVAVLTGCALPPREPPVVSRAPAGFGAALERALPYAVGVYGLDEPQADASEAKAAAPPADADGIPARIGGGIVIDAARGWVVTAAHVVGGAKQIVVKLADRRIVLAEPLGVDAETDIALLRLPVALPAPAPLGQSAALRVGDWVLAVGEPYGLNRSVAAGIVGGKDRHFADDQDLLFIQSDIAMNPGNSGGPLLDASGAVVGMNLRTVIGQEGTPGLSLSVPIEIVQQIAAELAAGGSVKRPRLDAQFDDLTPPGALARGRPYATGALITFVKPQGTAAKLALKPGDIVVGMNGRAIGHSADLTRALLDWRELRGTRVTVFRDGAYRELRLD